MDAHPWVVARLDENNRGVLDWLIPHSSPKEPKQFTLAEVKVRSYNSLLASAAQMVAAAASRSPIGGVQRPHRIG